MVKSNVLCGLLALSLATWVGCSGNNLLSDDDPKMLAATSQARSEVATFEKALAAKESKHSSFAIKVKLEDGDQVEHLWAASVKLTEKGFTAKLTDEPVELTNIKKGDQVEVAREEISDWMFVDNGLLKGGYTIRVLRDQLSSKERKEFDDSVPFRF